MALLEEIEDMVIGTLPVLRSCQESASGEITVPSALTQNGTDVGIVNETFDSSTVVGAEMSLAAASLAIANTPPRKHKYEEEVSNQT